MADATKETTLDRLTDATYELWRKKVYTSYEDMLDKVPYKTRHAILISCLDGQVCNGGFEQWISNGYCLQAKDVIRILKEMDTKNSLEIAEMIEGFLDELNLGSENKGMMGDYLDDDEEELDLEEQDSRYYEIRKVFETEVETYLNGIL